ncbi:MAG: hypothetical protein LBJ60_00695, partial [Tannerellaceae bacterium]|nr:hypothetical protein [Tannerellaceae bacterium]
VIILTAKIHFIFYISDIARKGGRAFRCKSSLAPLVPGYPLQSLAQASLRAARRKAPCYYGLSETIRIHLQEKHAG